MKTSSGSSRFISRRCAQIVEDAQEGQRNARHKNVPTRNAGRCKHSVDDRAGERHGKSRDRQAGRPPSLALRRRG